ncbi:uncharacterized protein SPSK_01102 [Sporothrix schenckii 1099-18]|uniref:Zn(2)-C6 fungal-type domain-containing protein n=1 Tax=Sporothrix schenckii 1099-18 TaxID=1397361 RepID=A0A0F2LZL3_SPOSC|nr:uncharacterized protein SPSK_01102 [Sporothrix schenckii 1099-18]KJR81341.1 hypothetical protein SPSK_01102 [Sporothrix schenckii 1099-18]
MFHEHGYRQRGVESKQPVTDLRFASENPELYIAILQGLPENRYSKAPLKSPIDFPLINFYPPCLTLLTIAHTHVTGPRHISHSPNDLTGSCLYIARPDAPPVRYIVHMTSGMSVSVVEHPPVSPFSSHSARPVVMSRPQVGIERLPARRLTNEPRESMNCKSCRKRKIKCNRLRPACEACQVFQCACIYDAVPKKRGPKTDILEALLKRVDGLEQKLKEKGGDEAGAEGSEAGGAGSGSGSGISPSSDESPGAAATTTTAAGDSSTASSSKAAVADIPTTEKPRKQSTTNGPEMSAPAVPMKPDTELSSFQQQQHKTPPVQVDTLLHTYFTRSHAKPFHILDESSFRQRLQLGQIPSHLLGSVCALASREPELNSNHRYTPHPNGYQAAVRLGEDYALRARAEIDVDEPSIDCLQTLLLLALAFVASGKGKKAYMLLCTAFSLLL